MNTLIRRGLQAALLTGGLWAVGTGVASADDGLDVSVPVTVSDNALAVLGDVPAPGIDLPALEADLGVDLGGASLSVPVTLGGNGIGLLGTTATQEPASPPPAEPADVSVPVTVAGNAVGVLGDATASGTAPAPAGSDGGLLGVSVPVTVCGNGIGVLGDGAGSCSTARGTPGTGGPGTGGPGVDVEVPVTVCGTGIGLLGSGSGTCGADVLAPPVTPKGPDTSGQPLPPAQAHTPGGPATPAALWSGGPVTGAPPTDSGAGASELAHTGAGVASWLLAAVLCLLAGLGTVVGTRRRDPVALD